MRRSPGLYLQENSYSSKRNGLRITPQPVQDWIWSMQLATPTTSVETATAAATATVEASAAASSMEAAATAAVEAAATAEASAMEATAATEALPRSVEVAARSTVVVHARRVGEGAWGVVGARVVEMGRVAICASDLCMRHVVIVGAASELGMSAVPEVAEVGTALVEARLAVIVEVRPAVVIEVRTAVEV